MSLQDDAASSTIDEVTWNSTATRAPAFVVLLLPQRQRRRLVLSLRNDIHLLDRQTWEDDPSYESDLPLPLLLLRLLPRCHLYRRLLISSTVERWNDDTCIPPADKHCW